jgi:Flp pilus assembly pilin Flp
MAAMNKIICDFLRAESGATAIEYGLIASLVVAVVIGALQNLGSVVLTSLFTKVATSM